MDYDFLDRTVLKLITDYSFEPLLKSDKVLNLLNTLWFGSVSEECDGRVTDFSMLSFLVTAPITALPKQNITQESILSNNFREQIDENCFTFQYKYRKQSIDRIFTKEILSTFFVSMIMILVNIEYLENFRAHEYS